MQDHRDSLELWGQQALRVQAALLELLDQSALLALVAHRAWLDLWVLPALQASEDLKAQWDQQARVARLVRRGVPAQQARQGLRVL